MDLLDSAADRLQDRFAAQVEAVRIGTVTAHDRRANQRWHSQGVPRGKRRKGLTGRALEREVMRIAELFPGNVFHEVAA